MVYPPGQGKSGTYLMRLWREYLEQYADRDGDVEGQIVSSSYHAVEIFGFLSRLLDAQGNFTDLIEERTKLFQEGTDRAERFEDCLVNATFSLYNHMNTLGHQFSIGNERAESLIREVDEQVRSRTAAAKDQIQRSSAALKAFFPLLSVVTLVLGQGEGEAVSSTIRRIQERFSSGDNAAAPGFERLLNALYRSVEMLQILVTLSDPSLSDQALQIAARFEEEDDLTDMRKRLRNGFSRLFELGHLLATHLDSVLS